MENLIEELGKNYNIPEKQIRILKALDRSDLTARKLSKETGIPLKDTVNHSYCFVKSGELQRNLFGKIGVYERREGYMEYFKFGKKLIGFDMRRDEIFWATNVIMLLEERERLFKLF